MDLLARARHEIEALHRFFVAWFTGACPDDAATFEAGVTARFADDAAIVQPGGERVPIARLAAAIRAGHGRNPAFDISIHNVQIEAARGDVLVVSYEEWQVNARNSTPPDNGRLSTAVFAVTPERLRWLHVHETWLPAGVMAAGTRPRPAAGDP